MTGIAFTAKGAEATAEVSGKLTSGTVGVPVHFTFSPEWSGLQAVAVFEGSGKAISVPLLGTTEATLPWEVVVKANTRLRIGAEGRKSDGTVVIPTVWADAGYIAEGVKATDDEGNPPTPGVYDQIMAAIEAGMLRGEQGEKGEQGPVGETGADGYSPFVIVTAIKGGHRVEIFAANAVQLFDVMDGKDGANGNDGVSPTANVTETVYGAIITVTDKNGTTTATVKDGENGRTPIKGVDYFTKEEFLEIVEAAAEQVEVPSDDHINSLIDAKLGVIENGTY